MAVSSSPSWIAASLSRLLALFDCTIARRIIAAIYRACMPTVLIMTSTVSLSNKIRARRSVTCYGASIKLNLIGFSEMENACFNLAHFSFSTN